MIQVPQSHLTLGVYNSTLGIGVAKTDPTFPVWGWAIVAVCASILLLAALFFYTRSSKPNIAGQMDPSVFMQRR